MYPGATASTDIGIRIPTGVIRITRTRAAIRTIIPIAASKKLPMALTPFFRERITYSVLRKAQGATASTDMGSRSPTGAIRITRTRAARRTISPMAACKQLYITR